MAALAVFGPAAFASFATPKQCLPIAVNIPTVAPVISTLTAPPACCASIRISYFQLAIGENTALAVPVPILLAIFAVFIAAIGYGVYAIFDSDKQRRECNREQRSCDGEVRACGANAWRSAQRLISPPLLSFCVSSAVRKIEEAKAKKAAKEAKKATSSKKKGL